MLLLCALVLSASSTLHPPAAAHRPHAAAHAAHRPDPRRQQRRLQEWMRWHGRHGARSLDYSRRKHRP